MIKRIKALLQLWNTPSHHLAEQHLLIVLAARRCAYDLKHAASEVELAGDRYNSDYDKRAEMWLSIFTPDGAKQYRSDLHREIAHLEFRIKNYQDTLKEHGIKDPGHIPF
jgi:hypothetical protein